MSRPTLDPADLRAYAGRDWGRARDQKREYWRARLNRGGLGEALRITGQLHDWMKLADPSWPSRQHREEDLETHRRVAEALAKTAPTSPVRRTPAARARPRRAR